MSDPNDPYSGGATPPPPPFGGGAITPPPGPGATPPPPAPPGGGYQAPPPPAPPGGGYTPPPPPGPPGGGYAPPPPGGGYVPPPAPPGGYQAYQPGGFPSGGGQADIGTAFSWTFAKFQQHLIPLLSLSGVIFLVNLVGGVTASKLAETSVDDLRINDNGVLVNDGNFWSGIIGSILISIVIALLVAFLRIGLLRAALRVTRGETPSFNDLMTGTNLVPYIIVAIVSGILTAIGLVLCVIPGLLVAFFLLFAPIHALDKGAGVGDALNWSFNAVKATLVPCIVLVLIGIVVGIISSFAGGIGGAVVAALLGLFIDPISSLLTANLYRQMGNEPIAA